MEDGSSVFILVGLLIYIGVVIVPISMVVRKAGFSGWWAITAMVPLLNLIMLWVFALKDWGQSRA